MIEEEIDAKKTRELSRVKKASILIFAWGAFLLFLGLHYKFHMGYNFLLFWWPILIMISIILYQIFFLKDDRHKSFILFEIFFVYLLLHLIFVVGYYGLRGSDSYLDYNVFKGILSDYRFSLESGVKGYPMLHIFSSVIYFFTKINPLYIAKFLPSLISSLIVFPVYFLIVKVYGDTRIALFSSLIFGTVPQFMSFETSYVREIFGLFIMVLFFYILCASIRKKYSNLYLILFVLIPVAIFSHHLSSFLLLCLGIIYLLVSIGLKFFNKILSFVSKKIEIIKDIPSRLNRKALLVILVFSVSLLSYWFYIYGFDLIGILIDNILDMLGFKKITGSTYAEYMNLDASIITLRGNILFYGFFFYVFLFSILLIIKFFIKDIFNKIEDTTFLIFYFLCMFLGFLSLYFISGSVFPDRLLTFAFLFGLIPITTFILILKKNIYKKIITVLFVSFIIFNLYNIDMENYTYNASYSGKVEGAVTEKEYLIAKHIIFPHAYYGYIAAVSAIYDTQGIEPLSGGITLEYMNVTDFRNSSSMAVINEAIYLKNLKNLQQKSPREYSKVVEILSSKNYRDIDKICDFGEIYVIKGGR